MNQQQPNASPAGFGLDWPPTWRRLAFVGVAKNSGKTTTLNFVVRQAAARGESLALMSLGIDGESRDALLGTAKPKIYVEPGQWVVTAQKAIEGCSARLEYVDTLGIETLLGEVFIARVLSAGNVVLAGLRHREDVLRALEKLEHCQINRMLIDGAYGRVAAAHAQVSDAVIVSTGAVVATSVAAIVEKTAGLIEPLTLAAVTQDRHVALGLRAVEAQTTLLGRADGSTVTLSPPSALLGLAGATKLWTHEVDAIAVPGLVSDRVAELLLGVSGPRRALIVPDGTSFHLSLRLWRRLCQSWDVVVLHQSTIAAISVNPTSVQGHHVDREQLIEALQRRWPHIALFDPLHHLAEST
ncbi:MAG: hypothetical protein H0U74_22090 [Bradymonadaceae bacterium]|nr:hypothetical protein [Lujinxingiaceae bacterium]